ncbi:hypothetical protein FRC10_011044 [Ceratobasidium sp. 414]|nr:hypothetical protein FRC10_011044 [Ceratobasidium sp. 414]
MSQPTEEIELNCHVLGDTQDKLFAVLIPPTVKVTWLVDAIVKAYQGRGYGQLQDPILYKVDLLPDSLPNIASQTQEPPLNNLRRVERYWENADIVDDHVHILVRAKAKPRAAEQEDTLGGLPAFLRELDIGQQNTAKTFREGRAASLAAARSQFGSLQEVDNNAIFNGRPERRTELPIQLFHPVFDTFTKTLEGTDLLPPAKYDAARELLRASQPIYRVEGDRLSALQPCMTAAFSSEIVKDPVPKCEADGVVIFTNTATTSKAYCAIIETRNEVGAGKSDPTIQAAESYAIYWSQEEVAPLLKACRCPSLIIAVAGPWMCVLGAVYLRNPVVQPLTDYIWLGYHPQQDRRLAYLTRVFHAVAVSIAELREYYKSLLSRPLPSTDLTRFLPYVRVYEDPNGNMVDFDYLGLVDKSFVLRPIFKAKTNTKQDIIVKFAERYNIGAHQMLVSEGLAPRVLYYKADFSHGELHMIVMEEVPCVTLEQYTAAHGTAGLLGLTALQKDIRDALTILHGADLVFGDLRPPNILVVAQTDGEARGMLVDFDWCDKENDGRYPAGINEKIKWVDGVVKGGLMSKEHDVKMFEKLFGDSSFAS